MLREIVRERRFSEKVVQGCVGVWFGDNPQNIKTKNTKAFPFSSSCYTDFTQTPDSFQHILTNWWKSKQGLICEDPTNVLKYAQSEFPWQQVLPDVAQDTTSSSCFEDKHKLKIWLKSKNEKAKKYCQKCVSFSCSWAKCSHCVWRKTLLWINVALTL